MSAVARAQTQPAAPLKAIEIAFRVDPGPTYGGVRWLAPSTFSSGIQSGRRAVIRVRVRGIDATGKPVLIQPAWTSTNDGMIQVAASEPSGDPDEVQIIVSGWGESRLTVAARGASKDLLVKSQSIGNGLGTQVSISQ